MNVKLKLSSLVVILLTSLIGCGGSGNGGVIRTQIAGQVYEARVLSTLCVTLANSGGSELDCSIGFSSRSQYLDQLQFRVNNIRPIYETAIGVWLPVSLSYFDQFYVTLQGQPQIITDGNIRFDQISNYPGDNVCAQVELTTQLGIIDGSFCAVIQ